MGILGYSDGQKNYSLLSAAYRQWGVVTDSWILRHSPCVTGLHILSLLFKVRAKKKFVLMVCRADRQGGGRGVLSLIYQLPAPPLPQSPSTPASPSPSPSPSKSKSNHNNQLVSDELSFDKTLQLVGLHLCEFQVFCFRSSIFWRILVFNFTKNIIQSTLTGFRLTLRGRLWCS